MERGKEIVCVSVKVRHPPLKYGYGLTLGRTVTPHSLFILIFKFVISLVTHKVTQVQQNQHCTLYYRLHADCWSITHCIKLTTEEKEAFFKQQAFSEID